MGFAKIQPVLASLVLQQIRHQMAMHGKFMTKTPLLNYTVENEYLVGETLLTAPISVEGPASAWGTAWSLWPPRRRGQAAPLHSGEKAQGGVLFLHEVLLVLIPEHRNALAGFNSADRRE